MAGLPPAEALEKFTTMVGIAYVFLLSLSFDTLLIEDYTWFREFETSVHPQTCVWGRAGIVCFSFAPAWMFKYVGRLL